MKAQENRNLFEWLQRKENVYTSPDIQNEMIKHMGVHILREIASQLHTSPFLTIMDKTTDASNVEQATHLFIGSLMIYKYTKISWDYTVSLQLMLLCSVVKDAFLRMNLSFDRVRGQCYDGASAMSGTSSHFLWATISTVKCQTPYAADFSYACHKCMF